MCGVLVSSLIICYRVLGSIYDSYTARFMKWPIFIPRNSNLLYTIFYVSHKQALKQYMQLF